MCHGRVKKDMFRGANYETVRVLGEGTYGTVRLIRQLVPAKTLVVKEIVFEAKKNVKRRTEMAKHECKVLSYLKDHCTAYFLCLSTCVIEKERAYIVTEYQGNQIDLLDWKNANPTASVTALYTIAYGLVMGLQQLHFLGLGHKDIKAENVLLHDVRLEPRYIDFGFSCLGAPATAVLNVRQGTSGGDDECETATLIRVGTPRYMAPELWTEKKASLVGAQQSDMWALGCLLFLLRTGQHFLPLAATYGQTIATDLRPVEPPDWSNASARSAFLALVRTAFRRYPTLVIELLDRYALVPPISQTEHILNNLYKLATASMLTLAKNRRLLIPLSPISSFSSPVAAAVAPAILSTSSTFRADPERTRTSSLPRETTLPLESEEKTPKK